MPKIHFLYSATMLTLCLLLQWQWSIAVVFVWSCGYKTKKVSVVERYYSSTAGDDGRLNNKFLHDHDQTSNGTLSPSWSTMCSVLAQLASELTFNSIACPYGAWYQDSHAK
jgi:hypothetical protein